MGFLDWSDRKRWYYTRRTVKGKKNISFKQFIKEYGSWK